jgi:dimethylaniline monooxygenase (N-oxide forming)
MRNEADTKWQLDVLVDGVLQTSEFDKVVFCHGYQTVANMPGFEGEEVFEGLLVHAQKFRSWVSIQDEG